ncbi:hypothetical protein MMY88_18280 [Acinetobacter baumannii]|uniref:hypothetical protein n=1 Tax=Acinetobacter baumannii TaxID=470 RepID=UPI002300912A|nr:hypothetical protein [Acinetobacter baumannii]MDA5696297.1 hypothetical protein [Acinetobacter baumannii]
MFIQHDKVFFNAKKVTWVVADLEFSNKVYVKFDNGDSREFTFQRQDEMKAFVEKITSASE